MAIECIRFCPRNHLAMIAALAAGALYLWTAGAMSDGGHAMPDATPVRISVSLLDMSRLEPAHFGDWETSPPAR